MVLGLSIVIFSIGRKLRRLSFQRLAVGCLLAASIAGISVNLVRSTAGRPRPMAGMKDGFYGPSLQYELHGFPSAHAATSMATAAVFVIPAPFIGIPMVGLAVGIDYSLFIIARVREERAKGLSKIDAIGRAGSTATRAVVFRA